MMRYFIPLALCAGLVARLPAQNHVYDAAGRLVWSAQPSGASTSISYDPAGNVLAMTSVTPGADADNDGIPDRFEIDFSGSPTGLDPGEGSPGSGVPNSVAYAFGASPSVSAGSFVLPTGVIKNPDSGEAFLRLQYQRPKDGPLLWTYTAEVSTGLDSWTSAPSAVAQASVEDLGGGLELVTLHARLQDEAGRLLARVRLTRVQP